MSSLKECPFCGAPASQDDEGFAFCSENCIYVDCGKAAWNRRAPSPAVKALVEACRDLIPSLRSGDWGDTNETACELEEAIEAVEREIEEGP